MSKPIRPHPPFSTARPNTRLKAAREGRRWSQQELADHLGITANSVSRWERGISSPGPYFRRQLCDLFGLSAQELGLLANQQEEADHQADHLHPTSLPILCTFPFQRNPFFTGREEVLALLHQRLQTGQRQASFPQALCGLAGVGKTQTAVEYGYRFAQQYQALLWLRAETQETLLADCLTLAALLKLPHQQQREPQRVLQAVKDWLQTQSDWLLILDNIEDLALLQQIMPAIHQGHLLLTTRAQATGTLAQNIPLKKMDLQESALFLLRRVKYLPLDAQLGQAAPAEQASAREIARLLDRLPLALDQAGAYIEETACRLPDYLDRYQARRAALLTRRGSLSSGHPGSVSTTLALVIEQVEHLSPVAADLLHVCAFLQPDAIPEPLLEETQEQSRRRPTAFIRQRQAQEWKPEVRKERADVRQGIHAVN